MFEFLRQKSTLECTDSTGTIPHMEIEIFENRKTKFKISQKWDFLGMIFKDCAMKK